MSAKSTAPLSPNAFTDEADSSRKVPLREVDAQLQMIEDLLNQLEVLAVPEMAELTELGPEQIADLVQAKQQAVALELQQMKQEQQGLYAQAINRMLNRAAYETRQLVGEEATARYYRAQASTLAEDVARRRSRVNSIKGVIAASLRLQGETRLTTAQHRMNLSTSTQVVIDQEAIPVLDHLLVLNAKYPGILGQLKFNDAGLLVDVEFRSEALKRLLKMDDDEVLDDLHFASLRQTKYLVVSTISEAKLKGQVQLEPTEYGVELSWESAG